MSAKGGLRLEKLSRRVGALRLCASFEIPSGVIAAITGPSGSGKTSLLRLIAGLDPIDGGRVWLGDLDLTDLPAERRNLGVVFQEQALFPSMTILENAAFGLRVRGIGRQEREREAMIWLERVGLASRAREFIAPLSGGERQRLALARALAFKPSAILLDEPFSALDREARAVLRRELLTLHREWPVPMLLVSHDEEDVASLASLRFSSNQLTAQ